MTDQAGRTGLHYAALEGDVVRAEELLAGGAGASVADDQGFTPLHFAAQSNKPEVVRLLVARGADFDRVNRVGNTALGLAVFNSEGRGEVIETLLEAGADPDKENSAGVSPRVLAERIANYAIKKFFLNA